MAKANKEWFVAVVLFFYYIVLAILLNLLEITFIKVFPWMTVSIIIKSILDFILPILIMILAIKLGVFLTRKRYIVKNDNKVILLASLFYALLTFGLLFQGYARGIEANYMQILLKISLNLIIFYFFTNMFWLGKKYQLVLKLPKL